MASITLSATSLSYVENGEKIALDAAALFDAAGLPGNNLNGFELSISFEAGGLLSDRLGIGVNAAEGVGLDGRIIRLNNTEIATFSGGIGTEPLVIRFNANAQFAAAQSVLRSLTYVNLSDALPETGDRSLSLQLRSAQQTLVASASRSLTATGTDDAVQTYQTLTLYDGSTNLSPTASGAVPNGPWLDFLNLTDVLNFNLTGGSATDQPGNGGTTLITDQAAGGEETAASAGFSNYKATVNPLPLSITVSKVQDSFPVLDRNQGYILSFTADLLSETRGATANKNNDGKDDRAGFGLTLLSEDLKGISLNFFLDRIWAHEDGTTQLDPSLEPDADPPSEFRTLFTQAEGVDFNTTELTQYDVAVKGELYTVFANGNSILSGNLRDYSALPTRSVPVGNISIDVPDFNELPSLVFLGDLTPSAGASTKITEISVSTPTTAPIISVTNGSVTDLPQFLLNDPDGNDQATTVLLSVSSGSLSVTGNNDVTVTADSRGPVLTGSIAAINTLLNNGQNFSYQPAAGFTGTVPITIAVGDDAVMSPTSGRVRHDFDGDGNSDLLWFSPETGQTVLWNIEADGSFQGRGAVVVDAMQDNNFQIQGTGDFNLDGKTDILWRNEVTGTTTVWFMDGGTFQGAANIMAQEPVGEGWVVESVADINRDGKSDLLWRNRSANLIVAWYLDSGSNGANIQRLGGGVLDAPGLDWQIQGMGDFNGDDKPDIVWRNTLTAATAIWYLDGLNLLPGSGAALGSNIPVAERPDLSWEIQGVGDYNRDGKTDVVWRNQSNGTTVIWNMDNTVAIGGSVVSPNVFAQLGLN